MDDFPAKELAVIQELHELQVSQKSMLFLVWFQWYYPQKLDQKMELVMEQKAIKPNPAKALYFNSFKS